MLVNGPTEKVINIVPKPIGPETINAIIIPIVSVITFEIPTPKLNLSLNAIIQSSKEFGARFGIKYKANPKDKITIPQSKYKILIYMLLNVSNLFNIKIQKSVKYPSIKAVINV